MPLGTPIVPYGGADRIPSQPSTPSSSQLPGFNSPGYPQPSTPSWLSRIGTPLSQGAIASPSRPAAPAGSYTSDPLIAALQAQLSGIQQQGTLAQAGLDRRTQLANTMYGIGVDQLNQQYGFDSRLLANERFRNIDLARQRAQGDYGANLADLARRLGLAGEAFGLAQRSAATDLDIAGRRRRGDVAYANQLMDFAGGEFRTRRDTNELANRAASRQVRSQAANRGSQLSAGFRDTNLELADQLRLADTEAQQAYNREIGGIDDRIRQSGLTFDRSKADIGQQLEKAGLTYKGTVGDIDAQRAEQRRAFDNQNKMLDSLADDYGIKADEMKASLANGIQSLGLDLNSTLESLAEAFQSGETARRAQAQTVINQILQAAMQSQAPAVAPAAASGASVYSPLQQTQQAGTRSPMESVLSTTGNWLDRAGLADPIAAVLQRIPGVVPDAGPANPTVTGMRPTPSTWQPGPNFFSVR